MNNLQASYNNAINELFALQPNDVKNVSNMAYSYYQKELLLKVQSIFNFENLPETWDKDYLLDNLFTTGYLIAVDKDGVNYLLTGGLTGINVYNKPTEANIANPVLGTFSARIGDQAELLYFNRVNGAFRPINDLIRRYAILLAQCDGSLNATLMNSRVAHLFIANNEAEARTYQQVYDKVSAGEPAVFLIKKKDLTIDQSKNMQFMDVRNTYIANDVLDTKRTIMNEFLTEIGINNANTDKKERLISSEVSANNTEVKSIATLWLTTMNECLDRINKLFNLNVKVSFNEDMEEVQYESMEHDPME